MLKQEGTCCEKKSEKKQESPAFKAGHNKVRRHLQKGENTMKVTLKDGSVKEYSEPMSVNDIAF